MAPALIVAARHQPVAGIRIAQHLVGDVGVVLHRAGDREAERAGVGRRTAPPPRRLRPARPAEHLPPPPPAAAGAAAVPCGAAAVVVAVCGAAPVATLPIGTAVAGVNGWVPAAAPFDCRM